MTKDHDFTDEQLLLTTVQAARVLAVSRTTVYQLIKDGELHPVHISRCCRLSWAELERYVMRLDESHNAVEVEDQAGVAPESRQWRRVPTEDGNRRFVVLEASRSGGDSAA